MYHYESNTKRFKKYSGKGDIRSYRPPKGWSALAYHTEQHPMTGSHIGKSEWWIKETKGAN